MNEGAKLRRAFAVLLSVAALSLGALDIYAASKDFADDTISELLRDVSHDFYLLPFALCAVMGHFFVNVRREEDRRPERFWWLVTACGFVLLRDLVNFATPLPTFHYANSVAGAIGFLLGVLWWPQGPQVVDQNA